MPKPSKRSRNPEQTKDALLAAAEELFSSRGLDGTRTDDIAKASGVNKAMISYYFGGKDGLYAAVLSTNMDPALESLARLRESTRPAPEKLADFIRIFGELHMEKPRFSEMLFRELLSGGVNLDRNALPRFLEVFGTLRAILEQGRAEGTLREIPIIHAHLSIMGGLMFFFSTGRFRRRVAEEAKIPFADPPPAEFVSFFRDLMTQAFSSRREPQ
ncbi:MAG: TetR family transcriptional regulator [Candidatus Eisenbacteria bacterium]